MTLWILTVTADGDITTTTHPSVDAALACFSDNFDLEREFPRTLTGMRAAADAQGIRAEITEHEADH